MQLRGKCTYLRSEWDWTSVHSDELMRVEGVWTSVLKVKKG